MQIAVAGAWPCAWVEGRLPTRWRLAPKLWVLEARVGARVAQWAEVLLPYRRPERNLVSGSGLCELRRRRRDAAAATTTPPRCRYRDTAAAAMPLA